MELKRIHSDTMNWIQLFHNQNNVLSLQVLLLHIVVVSGLFGYTAHISSWTGILSIICTISKQWSVLTVLLWQVHCELVQHLPGVALQSAKQSPISVHHNESKLVVIC